MTSPGHNQRSSQSCVPRSTRLHLVEIPTSAPSGYATRGTLPRCHETTPPPPSSGFGTLPVHKRLLTTQLDDLAARVLELRTNDSFVHLRVSRLRPRPPCAWWDAPRCKEDDVRRGEHLERLYDFVMGLESKFVGFKFCVTYHLLDWHLSQGTAWQAPARKVLVEFLSLNRTSRWSHPDFIQGLRDQGEGSPDGRIPTPMF